jgi:hypothetical protein
MKIHWWEQTDIKPVATSCSFADVPKMHHISGLTDNCKWFLKKEITRERKIVKQRQSYKENKVEHSTYVSVQKFRASVMKVPFIIVMSLL